ncbi:hypothetical protein UA08_07262 [Talaromyces atroroseus]|uniref:C2H2-type domain-containing protein n=1 Tax=Talaromyces atroroseus TaxID=1441469 RepID=A0A225AA34_TALAT|nr:hypothetical protein UA08_07262 [Talaromyces atroroseus]OKL57801.1 hypothetical protein UA08_07262 [Talaromyces atroroseus]
MPQERIERGKRVRACTICGRTFKRTEHCIRHERAHFRERPFSCRFCDKSYGRKDLLVRHERTLHADEWANAQLAASPSTPARPGRRRQNRDSWSRVQPLPQPLSQTEPQYKEEPPTGVRVNDETVIQFESFLPSPRVSSSSEISDPELVTGVSDGMDVEFPLDPNLSNGIHMLVGDVDNTPHEYVPTYPMDQRHTAYESYLQQHDLEHYNSYQGLPIDPSLTTDIPKNNGFPIIQDETFSRAENVNIFALFPDLTLDDQSLTHYFDGSFDDKVTPDLLKDTSTDDTTSSDMPPPESRRRGRPSRSFRAQSGSRFRKVYTEECQLALLADLQNTFACQVQESQLPRIPAFQCFINQYFQSFNNRLPILHLPSFDVSATPAPLLLAICSIGALFGSEKDVANDLRKLAKQALQSIDSTSDRPMWVVQCKILLIAQAAFGGDCIAVNWALENVGFFHREFTSRSAALSATRDTKLTSWTAWIERESSKRLLFGMFIISSLLTLTYNISPCLSTTEDLKIEMPAEESAWIAADEHCWKKEMATKVPPSMDVYQALTRVLFGKDFNTDTESQWPAFAVTILMHAVHVHMWHVTQSTQSFINFSANVKIEEQMKSLCTSQTEEVLERCYMIFAHRRPCDEEKTWDDVEGPLLFNGMAVLRSCYVRAFTGSGSFNRSILFSDDEEAIFRVAKDYMQIEQVRTPFLSAAVAQSFDGLLTPLQAVRKSPPDLVVALFYTKWVHTVETQNAFAQPETEEKKNLEKLLQILGSNDQTEKSPQSLAASAARLWADFIDSNWTWEVTRRMGKVLRKLAVVYEINKNMP